MLDSATTEKNYAEQFGVDPEQFQTAMIKPMMLSVRSYNCLKRAGVVTLKDLLLLTPSKLRSQKNVGQKSFDEIEAFINTTVSNINHPSETRASRDRKSQYLSSNVISLIQRNDFSFLENDNLREDEETYKQAEDEIGREMCQALATNINYAKELVDMLDRFVIEQERRSEREAALKNVPEFRKANYALAYYQAYNFTEEGNLSDLIKPEPGETLKNYILNVEGKDHYRIFNFISFCSVDLYDEARKYFSTRYEDLYLLEERSKRTLEELGNEFGLTRERIRQKEHKAMRKIFGWSHFVPVPMIIAADLNSPGGISRDDFKDVLREYSAAIFYSFMGVGFGEYSYSSQYSLYLRNYSSEKGQTIASLLNSLPKYLSNKELAKIQDNMSEGEKAVLKKTIDSKYFFNKGFWFSRKLGTGDKCEFVLRYFFPDGVHIYGENEYKEFAFRLHEYFGQIEHSNNLHRAIIANVVRVGALCDRGCYKYVEKIQISKTLAAQIEKYIKSINQPVLVIEDIYNKFANKLSEEGINNKYTLQSVLQHCFRDKYRVRRAFLFKTTKDITIYDEIARCVRESPYPITVEDIKRKVVGVNDVYIAWGTASDDRILNFFGSYFYADQLKLTDSEVDWLRNVIERVLSDGAAHPVQQIYNVCIKENPFVLQRNFVQYQYSLYSLLKFLFEDEYQFSRPLIAPFDVKIEDKNLLFRSQLYEYETISIPEIKQIAEETGYQLFSYQAVFESCIDKFFLRSKDEMISIELTGITEQIAQDVENMIADRKAPMKSLFLQKVHLNRQNQNLRK